MTLSARNFYLTAAILLFAGTAIAATPPDAEMAAASAAIASAERAQPRGPAASALNQARDRFAQAQEAIGRKKYRDALRLAEQARAGADLALAKARLANARNEVDEKSARNADLRRQLLVLPESQP
jgi:hypothetical protein